MEIFKVHDFNITMDAYLTIQHELAKQIKLENKTLTKKSLQYCVGIDAAYWKCCSA